MYTSFYRHRGYLGSVGKKNRIASVHDECTQTFGRKQAPRRRSIGKAYHRHEYRVPPRSQLSFLFP